MSIGGALVITVVVLFALMKLTQGVTQGLQKGQGRNRCQACGSRLKAVRGNYAGTCRKCGTKQSWAA